MSIEDLTTLFLLCVHVWTCLTIVFAHFKFPVSDWRHCDNGNEAFLIFRTIPLQSCLFECHVRLRCHAVEYLVPRRECRLLETETPMDRIALNRRTACVFIRMSDVAGRPQVPDICQNCTALQVCDVKTGSCATKECKRLVVKNANVFGNMQSIGSKVKISPHPGYVLAKHNRAARCKANGEWDNVPQPVGTCEHGWFKIEQSCYQTNGRKTMKFDDATMYCKKMNAHLLQIETEAESTQLEPYAPANKYDTITGWWIGIQKDDGQWRLTESNSVVSFFRWYTATEPNNYNGAEYCAMIGFKTRFMNWSDVPCSYRNKVICEKRLGE